MTQEPQQDTPQVSTNRFCTNCGSSILADALFCASCGTPLGDTTRPHVSQPPIAPAAPVVSPAQQPTIQQHAMVAPGNVGLSDIITAMGFIGVLLVFFAVPFGKDAFGQDVSTIDELGRVSDYTDATGAAALIYALWAVPVLAGVGLAVQLLALTNGKRVHSTWRSCAWCGALIVVALFASSAGYAALVSKVQDALSAEGLFDTGSGPSSTEVFFWPITGIGNDAQGYTMMTACAVAATVSAFVGGSSRASS